MTQIIVNLTTLSDDINNGKPNYLMIRTMTDKAKDKQELKKKLMPFILMYTSKAESDHVV